MEKGEAENLDPAARRGRGARYRESTDGYTPLSKDVFVATSIYILRIRIFKLCGQYNNI